MLLTIETKNQIMLARDRDPESRNCSEYENKKEEY